MGQMFPDLFTTMQSLFSAIFGGFAWYQLVRELDDDVSESMGTFMAFYIIAGNFVLMNMIMTVFVERLTKNIREDKDTDAAEAFAKLFSTEGGEKEVTWEDFARNLEEPAMQDYFQSMDLHVNAAEARALFDLIDVDDSGTLSNDE